MQELMRLSERIQRQPDLMSESLSRLVDRVQSRIQNYAADLLEPNIQEAIELLSRPSLVRLQEQAKVFKYSSAGVEQMRKLLELSEEDFLKLEIDNAQKRGVGRRALSSCRVVVPCRRAVWSWRVVVPCRRFVSSWRCDVGGWMDKVALCVGHRGSSGITPRGLPHLTPVTVCAQDIQRLVDRQIQLRNILIERSKSLYEFTAFSELKTPEEYASKKFFSLNKKKLIAGFYTHTTSAIHTALTNLDKSHDKKAIMLFKYIQGFMKDRK